MRSMAGGGLTLWRRSSWSEWQPQISTSYVLVVVVLSRLFLNESIGLVKIAGISLTIAGGRPAVVATEIGLERNLGNRDS